MRTPTTRYRDNVLLSIMLLCTYSLGNTATADPEHTKATTRLATPLLAQPEPQAPVVTTLAQATPLAVITRQGGWYQVRPEAHPTGWVRLFALQLSRSLFRPDNQPLTDLKGLVIPGHHQITSTTGVRGLDEVAIQSARADFNALLALQSLQQQPAAAEAFAAAGGLTQDFTVQLKQVQP